MSRTVLSVCNSALGVCGAKGLIASIEDNRREAELCREFYEPTRDLVFSSAHWPSLTGVARLALIREKAMGDWVVGDPAPGNRYAYRLPNDYLYPRHLQDLSYFSLSQLNGELTLQTNSALPILNYTRMIEAPTAWDVHLYGMVIAALAMELARGLGADAKTYGQVRDNFQMKSQQALTAQANLNQVNSLEVLPEWLAAREGALAFIHQSQSFYYPTQALLYGSS